MSQPSLRNLPSVDWVLSELGKLDLPRPVVVAVVRRTLEEIRSEGQVPEREQILKQIQSSLAKLCLQQIRPVINGTGVLIHTNLGRAPLGEEVVRAVATVACRYSNLEFDLETGKRASRSSYLKHNLALLSSTEAATIVNNNASALMLILHHLCKDGRDEVVVSRGELVQIGGGFRIPDILEASGAKLCEVGTTNKTSLEDYERAMSPKTAMVLKVHRSNFFMAGFVESPSTKALAELCQRHDVPMVEDLGSGAVVATEDLHPAIDHEPTVAEVTKQGVDLVTFSGDKLLGGPQAGIIAGKKTLVEALEQDPFYRGLRCDKMVLVALQMVVESYLTQDERYKNAISIATMLKTSLESLRERAERIVAALADVNISIRVLDGESRVGGGSLPCSTLPSVVISIQAEGVSADSLATKLRTGAMAVVGYVNADRLCLDMRTIFTEQDRMVIYALKAVCGSSDSGSSEN